MVLVLTTATKSNLEAPNRKNNCISTRAIVYTTIETANMDALLDQARDIWEGEIVGLP